MQHVKAKEGDNKISFSPCCGSCLKLYRTKAGRQVWLCNVSNQVKVSNADEKSCRILESNEQDFGKDL